MQPSEKEMAQNGKPGSLGTMGEELRGGRREREDGGEDEKGAES